MPTCCGQDYDSVFDAKTALQELKKYRRKGPTGSTRRLLDALKKFAHADAATLLDIGGGVGVIQHERAQLGAQSVVSVEASKPYAELVAQEATARGYRPRLTVIEGDFVTQAHSVPEADIVTLDKVICCYPDMSTLVSLSAQKARHLYGLTVPPDGWFRQQLAEAANTTFQVMGTAFKAYVHSHQDIDAVVENHGLKRIHTHNGWLWNLRLYERQAK